MTRRGFFGLAAIMGIGDTTHQHKWQESPFWLSCSVSFEEPTYYPPSSLYPVQMCSCGQFRIDPDSAALFVGKKRLNDAKSK